MRIRLRLAYYGPAFSGWQSQADGSGVQDAIEGALRSICSRPVRIHGAGRTDAGVHATGQVAHFDVPACSRLEPECWFAAINAHLPPTIRILGSRACPGNFHARFSAKAKSYHYRIYSSRVLPPLEYRRAWHRPDPPQPDALRHFATLIQGTHDFRAFSANRGKPMPDTHRTIYRVSISRRGPVTSIKFVGSGFLYKMVRILTATLLAAASGNISESELIDALRSGLRGRTRWPPVAPAHGLYLSRVHYALPVTPCRS